MYTIDDLNVRLLSELKDIAEEMGVKNARKLAKQDLVYKILDQQALTEAAPAKKQADDSAERKMRPRRRENVSPTPPPVPAQKEVSSEELQPSPDLDNDQPSNNNRFDEPQPKFEEAQPQPQRSEERRVGKECA